MTIASLAFALLAATGAAPMMTSAPQDAVSAQEHLASAQGSCGADAFDTFLQEFIWSRDVRKKYSAATLDERAFAAPSRPGTARPANPDAFEISTVDYTYADTASVNRWEKDQTPFTELWIDRTQLPGGGWRIQYQPAILKDDGEGDGKTLIRKTGKPRAYVFTRDAGCWKLTQWLK